MISQRARGMYCFVYIVVQTIEISDQLLAGYKESVVIGGIGTCLSPLPPLIFRDQLIHSWSTHCQPQLEGG